MCDEYKGLTVFGKNFAEIEARLPGVIFDYFSVLGYEVERVGVLDLKKKRSSGVSPPPSARKRC